MRVSVEKPGTPTELVHAGVKGMRWGVRKRDYTESRAINKAAEKARSASLREGGRSRFRLGLRPRDYGDVRRANQAARKAAEAEDIRLRRARGDTSKPMSPEKRAALAFVGVTLLAFGTAQTLRILQDTGSVRLR